MILYMSFRKNAPLLWFLVFSVFVSGLVMAARLKMMLHTPGQVWGGFFTGFACSVLFLYFFQQLV
jgi:membrane-associated phospholipid phosphatase